MDCPAPGLRLEAITPLRQEIMRIWRTLRLVDRAFIQGIIRDMVMFTETPVDWIFLRSAIEFWDPEHAVFNFQGTELAPTIEEYAALIQRPTSTTQGIFVPNPIAWLSDWTLLRALTPSTASYQRDECHGFLLLVFGTLMFPYSPKLIDGAIAQVVLQAVGGHSYVEALLAETVRSLDYVREVRRGRMRGSPHLLQIWLLAHVRPFCSSHPFSYITDKRSLIERLGSTSPQLSQTTPTPRAIPTPAPEIESCTQAAMLAELRAIREERDRLRCELVDSRVEVADYRELQMELARARARVTHLDREMAYLSVTLDRVRVRAREISHP
ncbi:hypothetical protein CRG98_021205 [Punica granatum]|uniref:DUF7745 domain-containing protein n=1 Tax=Punica granatum TaxID=22663 RepID=A0A2I0JQ15_PUNGR|nr:hypothetical protein CRG98_021205 [Punica granatum]